MLAFKDAFNNEDPLANLEELHSLHSVSAALPLVFGNLVGLWTTYIAARLGCYFLAAVIFISVIVSAYLYHLCQTTHECFQFRFFDTVVLDHFTATTLFGLHLLYKVNVRTVCQILHSHTILRLSPCIAQQMLPTRQPDCCDTEVTLISTGTIVYQEGRLDPDRCVCGHEMDKHYLTGQIGENGIYDWWTSVSTFIVIFVTVIAVVAHPFSYAAFTIVATTVVLLAFIKIMLIEEGEPLNFNGRISWPELLVAKLLSIVGLAAYVIDSYTAYKILHSTWHIFIYAALGFELIGTMKSVNGWFPLIKNPCCS